MKISTKTGRCAVVPVWLVGKVSARAVTLYVLLAGQFADYDTDEAEVTRKELARLLDVSDRTVDAAMRELVDAGAVEKIEQRRGDGSHSANLYLLDPTNPDLRGVAKDSSPGVAKPASLPSLQNENLQNEGTTDVVPSPAQRPKAVRVDGRDLPMDALQEECSVDPKSNRMREVVAAVNGTRTQRGIREQAHAERPVPDSWTQEAWERWLAIQIHERAAMYRRKMPGVMLTPTALAKWWTDLPGMPDPAGRSGSAADVVGAVDAAVRRARGEEQ